MHPINVVVVADTDMLDDRFWVQSQDFFGQQVVVPLANNGDFVADAIDVLAGGEDLIGLRSRGTAARPFEVVDRIQREAQARYSAEEQALRQKLKGTEAKLADLTGKDQADSPASLSPEQTKAIEQFRADMLQTRRQLRDVQAALRSNIQHLKERARIPRYRADPDHRRGGRDHRRRGAPEAPPPAHGRDMSGASPGSRKSPSCRNAA